MRYHFSYDSEIGKICLMEENGAITHMHFLAPTDEFRRETADRRTAEMMIEDMTEERETDLIKKAWTELQEYLAGTRKDFDIPLAPRGTEFQKKVWKALLEIPYGETRTYKDIAERCGNAKACRAVGMANNRNPISVFIPCHRVVGANGKLVGYGGGLSVKEKLLELEK
ncbi:methylated-DNA--[protein]-cysteine S-methyltransferase [Bacilliculturomica massiliensis]|uniref:methylated-DNA--[protein]-cysteine S-methyltransferase n=1 Tax=Bacilliculturomica massiliensis TaxID=1917867 RepID=UPI001030AF74|nr:methylated-DNA--[protein]-cysteine S-methyltransferase [Bacilliculturomica massiliensis]